MVLERASATLSFFEWFPTAALSWLVVVGGVCLAALLIGWLATAVRHGPLAAARIVGRVLANAAVDLVSISPRRVWALGWLAVRESIRRRRAVAVVFAVFIVVLMFAGWFLDPTSTHPARLYLSFVLTATSYLVLVLALFLSAFSLPSDIKSKTLHTVVTKPVRASEVVLGRILGFAAVGTLLLVVMGAMSYGFVVRWLGHSHELAADNLRVVEQSAGDKPELREGFTSRVREHRHKVTVDASDRGSVAMKKGHWHYFSAEQSRGKTAYGIGPAKGMLLARVPIYGTLRFLDRTGKKTDKGVNVGYIWTYRSYIEGGGLATAIWTFDGVTEERFPEEQFPKGLPLEMTIEVFRTYKGYTGDPDDIPGIPGSLSIRNPKTGKMVDQARTFTAKEFTTDVLYIPRELETSKGEKLDLFADLIVDGKLEVRLQCMHEAQYFGAAQADLYLRARDSSFTLNFIKGYVGIWLQMVLIIGFGVLFSTFLSGAVAAIATLGVLVGGLFRSFMFNLAASQLMTEENLKEAGREKVMGGGPIEAIIRILTHENLITDMEPGLRTTVAQMVDVVLSRGMYVTASILPGFRDYSFADYVAYGFDISSHTNLQSACSALGYLVPLFVAAYLFLKTREVAR